MKKVSLICLVFIAFIATAFTYSMVWNIEDKGIEITFDMVNEGTKGTLSGLKASIDFDKTNPAASKITATVDVNTFDTGSKAKDNHMKSSDFFDAAKYPVFSFSSTEVKVADAGFVAKGNLTIKDSTKAVEIPFTFTENAEGKAVFKGSLTLFSSDYGIMKKGKSEKDKVLVTIVVPVIK